MTYITLIPAHLLVKPELKSKIDRIFNTPDFRHRAVMAIFPEFAADNPRKSANILFRLETPPGLAPRFVIQSDVAPTPEALPRGAKLQQFTLPSPLTDSAVSFRLAVNPVIRHSDKTTSLVPVFGKELEEGEESLEVWLSKKLGSAFKEISIINSQREVLLSKPSADGLASKKIVIDLIDGVGKVGNPQALVKLQEIGVGRAKPYGCGLLSIKQL